MIRAGALLVALLSLSFAVAQAAAPSLIPPFDFARQTDGLPEGWRPTTFHKIERHTRYAVVEKEGRIFLSARADNAASGLHFRREMVVTHDLTLSWRWRVATLPERSDQLTKSTDDYAARVYVIFKYDPDKASLAMWIKYEALRLFHDAYPPHAALCYVWGARRPVGAMAPSPYTDRTVIITKESGTEFLGQWRAESATIRDDYRKAFGEAPPLVAAIGVMTDSDNSASLAEAWYKDIRLTHHK